MARLRLASTRGSTPVLCGHSFLLGQAAWHSRPPFLRGRTFASQSDSTAKTDAERPALFQREAHDAAVSASTRTPSPTAGSSTRPKPASGKSSEEPSPSLPPGWEDEDWNITAFSQLPHRYFGANQHMRINEEFKESLRQILWQFRAPIKYAFAYGSGVFPQSDATATSAALSPHPHPPEAVLKWQKGGGKMIDFIFGVTYTQHWHSLNLTQHRDHYSFLGSLGSGLVSAVQDRFGAGVYFNPYITVNGTLIKYGVVNLDTLYRDLSEWDTLYLAGRLQKPVKILRDEPRIRMANQINLISAVRTALLMLPETFTEKQLFSAIAGLSYTGDPRMSFKSEDPKKVSNIVNHQLVNFRQLYDPFIEDLPNVSHNDPRVQRSKDWEADTSLQDIKIAQDMDPVKRGNMVRRLPKAFRQKLYALYQRKFAMPQREFDKIVEGSQDEDATSFKKRQGTEFDRRIAGEPDLREMVTRAINQTVKWPSTSQSLKGLVTAGPSRTVRYLREKAEKGRKGKAEKDEGAKKKKTAEDGADVKKED
ncbi:hypothetical protein W97_07834 [Coniosporium apollinis CBS 100218]|uniref:Phosphatidate cytidylyltransferase, mitochondrial n=1 Tax=Coniosporium apollinis (strain CBS 100218) TaxID=1168221 RepID=R7Z3U1_CONA1|nr:uncharacterized protein W97_07834 [Coniosporium apollinis CBS 100218]EON68576.1 hypothetical protein W97_07834 [Coniosporium apollinis CBS 100218]